MSYQIKNYKNSLRWLTDAVSLSTGKKYLMGFTGFFLIMFLMVHLFGNMLLLKHDGGLAFNAYSKSLLTNVLIRVIEIFLFAGFILHIIFGITVSIQNKNARGKQYAVKSNITSSFFSRHMIETGSFILIFLLIHLKTFFYAHRIMDSNLTMYESVVMAFQNIYYTGFYVFIMILLSFHLMHGFQSAFQSFGLNHNKYSPLIKIIGLFYAVVVPGLFALIPFYIYMEKITLQ
ncbi:MAG: succinate dehydrogenase cytochrome b subunit [Spirochaetia bacterium]|nr:succinate dehydrogenase cytochrome b subunit [Spirochaetia bacterium]